MAPHDASDIVAITNRLAQPPMLRDRWRTDDRTSAAGPTGGTTIVTDAWPRPSAKALHTPAAVRDWVTRLSDQAAEQQILCAVDDGTITEAIVAVAHSYRSVGRRWRVGEMLKPLPRK